MLTGVAFPSTISPKASSRTRPGTSSPATACSIARDKLTRPRSSCIGRGSFPPHQAVLVTAVARIRVPVVAFFAGRRVERIVAAHHEGAVCIAGGRFAAIVALLAGIECAVSALAGFQLAILIAVVTGRRISVVTNFGTRDDAV